MRTAISDLRRFERDHGLWDALETNFNQLRSFIASATTTPSSKQRPFNRDQTLSEANRHLLNYLASVRLFFDYSTHRLKREGQLAALDSFLAKRRSAFDQLPAFRLMEQIRNFTQHRGLPIGGGHLSVNSQDGRVVAKGELAFLRDGLLEDAKIHSRVRADLQSGADTISVLPVAESYHAQLVACEAILFAADTDQFRPAFDRMLALFDEIEAGPSRAPMIVRLKRKDGQVNMESIDLPRDALIRFQRAGKVLHVAGPKS